MEEPSQIELDLETLVTLRVDQKIAQICVWAVHHDRVEQGRLLCEKQGCVLTEDAMFDVAFFFKRVWQIDATREERERCFLCKAMLPLQFERLCHCYRVAQVGRYLEPTMENMDSLRKLYPHDWHERNVETLLCNNCGDTFAVPAGVVAAKLRRGRIWNSPKVCMLCFRQHRRAPAPPQKRAPLKELQQAVANFSPSPAKS